MRIFLLYLICIIGAMGVMLVGYFLYVPQKNSNSRFLSPLPDFLTIALNKQVTLLDLWSPFIKQAKGDENSIPSFTAHSVLIYDLTTDKTLFEYQPQLHLPMASLTKIMTATISLENKRPDDRYVVSSQNLVGEDSMGLSTGEVMDETDLLYGLMLPSGNDAAEVLATDSPFGRTGFIKAMNDKARALGLTDTVFSNPSGLQGDGTQYTTALDLLVMTRYAMDTYPLFAKVVSTYEYDIPQTEDHKAYQLFNETNLLTSYPGVKGVKTGYTPEAGLCLVTYLDYKGHRIIGIILDSEDRREEMKMFLDYSLKEIGITPPTHQ
ncbi:MAG TPA: serine hydrolase [Patescibacteria group bacterium]|nr:serine hydrolase [Patescibacteria group bacterium]